MPVEVDHDVLIGELDDGSGPVVRLLDAIA